MKPVLFFILIVLFSAASCKKNKAENYTVRLAGTKIWRVYSSGFNGLLHQNYADTTSDTFAISVISPTTISVKGDTLNFMSKDAKNGLLLFSAGDTLVFGYHYQLMYYYNTDSIHYHKDFSGGSSGNTADYYTP